MNGKPWNPTGQLSRRALLSRLVFGVGALGFIAQSPVLGRLFARRPSLADYRLDLFQLCEGGAFKLAAEDGSAIHLTLDRVTDVATASVNGVGRGARLESFSLRFRGPARALLVQGTYHLFHREMGGVDLFLVPQAQQGEHQYFEAVINRIYVS